MRLLLFSLFLRVVASMRTYQVTARYPNLVKVSSLFLRGDNCALNWETGREMIATDNNTWSIVLDNCPDIMVNFELKVLVNDKIWMLGGNHHADVNGSGTTLFPWFFTTAGTLEIAQDVYSSELKNSRDVIFYLPPSYYENTLKTHDNILVMHDGQNLFLAATAYMGNAWYCQDTLDGTIIGGTTDEVIIVGPYNTDNRNNEYTYIYDPSEGFGGLGDQYLDWIESTLLPLTRSRYRVNLTRDTLGILGSSLGGLISCYAAWTRPGVYGRAGCMSSSFWWDDKNFQNVVVPGSVPPNSQNTSFPEIYMDSGTGSIGEIECTEYTLNIYDQMISDGFVEGRQVWRYVDEGGQHSESYWGPRFHIPMEALYPPSAI